MSRKESRSFVIGLSITPITISPSPIAIDFVSEDRPSSTKTGPCSVDPGQDDYGGLPQECGVTADLSFSSGLFSAIHPRTAHSAKLDQEHQGFFTRTPDNLARWPENIGHLDGTLLGVIDFRYEGDASHGWVVLGMTAPGTRESRGNGDHRAQRFGAKLPR